MHFNPLICFQGRLIASVQSCMKHGVPFSVLAQHQSDRPALRDSLLGFAELLKLTVPIELADDSGVLAPVGLDLYEELEKNAGAEDGSEFLAGFGADFLHRGAALADENPLLAFALDV